jgi:3-deoxy-D-manno-octulosonate 8-phosphate phosphatase (KDO 8-P phosphatase)
MDIGEVFTKTGGYFLTPADQITQALTEIRALAFDWDGVFNDGMKTGESGSPFSEIDSMGINLLRFSWWLKFEKIPRTFVVTGMNNHTAIAFSRREHFDGIFLNYKDKSEALNKICEKLNITPGNIAFFFDDVIDVGAAKNCGLSFCVNNKSDPLFIDFLKRRKIGDYITASKGNDHAIREICTLLIGLTGNYDQVVDLRMRFKGEYKEYLDRRNLTDTEVVLL